MEINTNIEWTNDALLEFAKYCSITNKDQFGIIPDNDQELAQVLLSTFSAFWGNFKREKGKSMPTDPLEMGKLLFHGYGFDERPDPVYEIHLGSTPFKLRYDLNSHPDIKWFFIVGDGRECWMDFDDFSEMEAFISGFTLPSPYG